MLDKKKTIEPGDIFYTDHNLEIRILRNFAPLGGRNMYPGKVFYPMSKSERIMRDLLNAGKKEYD